MRCRFRGHNLLEMIIACFIFSTVALGCTTIWIQHSHVMARSGARLVGQFLANQLMEECIAAGFDKVDLLRGARAPVDIKETIRDQPKVTKYTPVVDVTDTTLGDGRLVKVVKVTVSWEESGATGSLEYTSQLSDSGVAGP